MRAKLTLLSGAAAICLACGGSGGDGGSDGFASGGTSGSAGTGMGGTAATGAAGGGGGGGFLGRPCMAASECNSGEFCSVTMQCLTEGTCGADGDCDSGNFCSTAGECIPTGTCRSDGDCTEAEVCNPQNQCVPGEGCGGEEFGIEAIVPNMIIVLDRSCSMRRDLDNNLNPAGPNKWTNAVDAINQLTTGFSGQIRWGLILFPDITGGNCVQDAPEVSLGDSNEGPVQSVLNAALNQSDPNFPDGPCVTNIDTAVEQAAMQPEVLMPNRPTYVLLITDGKQAGCNRAGGDRGTEMILGNMFAGGVPTFVVGFGGAIDPAQMDIFAAAGGVPRMGSPMYYQADDAMQLSQALDQIAGSIVGCNFSLSETPSNPDEVFVFFDDMSVPRDPTRTEGWDYDATSNTITFHGNACTSLEGGQIADVDVVFGCDEPTPF